jgi:hypothetical protein
VTIIQAAAATTIGSTLANTYTTPVPVLTHPHIVPAINSLSANQQVLYQHITPLSQQMAEMSFGMQPSTPRRTFTAPHLMPFNVPPIQQLTIMPPLPFQLRGFQPWTLRTEHRGMWPRTRIQLT